MDVVSHAPMPKGPKILVANHPTTSDPFILLKTTRDRLSVCIKQSIFGIPLFGTYLKLSGHIPVNLQEGRQAYDRALKYLNEGVSVLVFIEGDITPMTGVALKPRTGAVRLAYASGAPIIPIGIGIQKKNIHYIDHTIRGKYEQGLWYFRGRYALTIGKPLHVTGNIEDRSRVRFMTQYIMNTITKLATASANRVTV